ncbi:SdpI family protein [Mucilaginibacter pedocola]|uniref:SdpI/YhfL protein family n=1 Tax=Mucilaginibacter pedocola TaxID=1792845 RepID=A0A1S9PI40_9SPHI|nr:SdpI family protein [Mucilaginibacter pedocola]OOQ60597.1 hypothetical protein BC343_23660 [Mucilaginibacter pedocola]
MFFVNWIIGPQLLAIIFLIAGYIQKLYPPKKINALYGYRTDSSMKNQQTWDEGNRYSTALMIKYAWVMLLGGFALTVLLMQFHMEENAFVLTKVGLMLFGAGFITVNLFRLTERHLKNLPSNKN